MTAAGTNQKADTLREAPGHGLQDCGLALARHCGGVSGATTVGLTLAGDLKAAIWVHAISESIWTMKREGVRTGTKHVSTWLFQNQTDLKNFKATETALQQFKNSSSNM